jgi:hypothetical protein
MKLDNAALPGIKPGQLLESFMQREDINRGLTGRRKNIFDERDLVLHSSPLGGATDPGMVHENVPHELRGYGEKVSPAFPMNMRLRHGWLRWWQDYSAIEFTLLRNMRENPAASSAYNANRCGGPPSQPYNGHP